MPVSELSGLFLGKGRFEENFYPCEYKCNCFSDQTCEVQDLPGRGYRHHRSAEKRLLMVATEPWVKEIA